MWNPENILPRGWTALRLLWTPEGEQPKRNYLHQVSQLDSRALRGLLPFAGTMALFGSFVGSLAITLGIMAAGAIITRGTETRWDFGLAWVDAARQDAVDALSGAPAPPLMLSAVDLSSMGPAVAAEMAEKMWEAWHDASDVSEGASPRAIREDLVQHASEPWGIVWDERLMGNAREMVRMWRGALVDEAVQAEAKSRAEDAAILNAEFIKAIAGGANQETAAKIAVKNAKKDLGASRVKERVKRIDMLLRAFDPTSIKTFKASASATERLAGHAGAGWQREALHRYIDLSGKSRGSTLWAWMSTMFVLMAVSSPLIFLFAAFRGWEGHVREPLKEAKAYWSLASATRRPAKSVEKKQARL